MIPAHNRRELTLEERGAMYLLRRAIRYLMKSCYVSGQTRCSRAGITYGSGLWEPASAEEAKYILDSCAAAVFHGGEPRRAKKLTPEIARKAEKQIIDRLGAEPGCKHLRSEEQEADGLVSVVCLDCGWRFVTNPEELKRLRDGVQ